MHENHNIKTTCTNVLPDDEHLTLETCRRHKELNQTINLKRVYFVGLCYIVTKSMQMVFTGYAIQHITQYYKTTIKIIFTDYGFSYSTTSYKANVKYYSLVT